MSALRKPVGCRRWVSLKSSSTRKVKYHAAERTYDILKHQNVVVRYITIVFLEPVSALYAAVYDDIVEVALKVLLNDALI